MNIQIETSVQATVVRIMGSVDGMTADSLLQQLQAQIAQGSIQLVGDLSGVDYTSSAGLRTLLATVKETRRLGGDFRLAAVQPDVLKVLELSGFTSILRVFGDVDSAVASFGS